MSDTHLGCLLAKGIYPFHIFPEEIFFRTGPVVCLQVVRTVIAGGLLQSMEALVQAAPQAKQRQQTAALVPIK